MSFAERVQLVQVLGRKRSSAAIEMRVGKSSSGRPFSSWLVVGRQPLGATRRPVRTWLFFLSLSLSPSLPPSLLLFLSRFLFWPYLRRTSTGSICGAGLNGNQQTNAHFGGTPILTPQVSFRTFGHFLVLDHVSFITCI